MKAGLTAAVLFSAPAFADDAQQMATTTMRQAMAERASMPTARHTEAGNPSSDAKAGAQQVKTMKHSPGAQHGLAADQAAEHVHQHATADGATQADSMHAAMANKAAMNAMSTAMMGGSSQAGSDRQNGAGMMRSMNSGAGMTGGSTSGGSSTGGATPGTPGTPAGGSSMPMGGKR